MEIRQSGAKWLLDAVTPEAVDQLKLRELPRPKWSATEGAYQYRQSQDEIRALRFLVDSMHCKIDAGAHGKLVELAQEHGLRDDKARHQGLHDALRPYQKEGVQFILQNERVLLADAMGLGKTLQALAALEDANAYPAVVVAPASVKLGWQREVLKWMPWRTCQVLMAGRDRLHDVDLVILNPELLGAFIEDLERKRMRAAVFDESHYFKNPRAQRSMHAMRLANTVERRIALTGTPIQNRRDDLIQQLKLLGQLDEVLHIYRGVLPHWWTPDMGELRWDQAAAAIDNLPRGVLHSRLRDVCMIRRTKHEVAQDLPSFTRLRREVPMGDRKGYRKAESAFVSWIDKMRGLDEAGQAGQRLVGRQHLSRLRKEAAIAKTAAVVDWAQEMADGGERVVFFAHHKAVVKHLVAELERAVTRPPRGPGKPRREPRVAVITGETHPHHRRTIIDSMEQTDFLVATMDSTGQGVDGLQLHVNHVAFVELDWTPTKHEQCEGRLHRIGQTEPVTAWYFTAADSIEGSMLSIIDHKWTDVEAIIDGRRADKFVQHVVDDLVGETGERDET